LEDGGIGINEILLQLPIAAVAIWALITSIRGRNAADVRRADTEKGQQALETLQLKFGDAEKARRAAMDERWSAMVQQMVANNTSLTEAVKGMAVLEQQNQRLLNTIVEDQQANTTSLATLTGAMDAAVASLGRIEIAITNGNGDHQTIAKTLVRVTSALGRIEAKLTPPPPTTEPDIEPGAHDDEAAEEKLIA